MKTKNENAVALGKIGGKNRWKKTTKKERLEYSRKMNASKRAKKIQSESILAKA